MLIDAFLPECVTELAVDSIFMMPHLGLLSTINARAATEVFEKDCLIRLGTCVAPWGEAKPGQPSFTAKLTLPGGRTETHEIKYGDLVLVPLGVGETAQAELALWFRPDELVSYEREIDRWALSPED